MKFTSFIIALACLLLAPSQAFSQLTNMSGFARAAFSPMNGSGHLGIEKGVGKHHSVLLSSGMEYWKNLNTSEKEIEKGWSNAVTIGYRYYLDQTHSGLFGEFDATVAYRRYQWADRIAYQDSKHGYTNTWTALPTIQFGYSFQGMNFWDFSPLIGVTYVKHLHTTGHAMSEGIMPTLGVQVNYWFR